MLQTANGTLSSRRQVHVGVTVFLSFPPDARPRTKRQPKRGTTGGQTDVPRSTTARTRLSATRLRPGAFRKRKRRACGRNVLAFMGGPWRNKQWAQSAPPTTGQLSSPPPGATFGNTRSMSVQLSRASGDG